jgi:hypothetical protein
MTCRAVVAAMRPKPSGGVVPLLATRAVRGELLGHHAHQTGLAVDVDARVRLVAVGVAVGGDEGGLDRLQHRVEGDLLVCARWRAAQRCRRSRGILRKQRDFGLAVRVNSPSTAARSTSA